MIRGNRYNNDGKTKKFTRTRKRSLHKVVAIAVVTTLVATSFISSIKADAGDLDPSFDLDGDAV